MYFQGGNYMHVHIAIPNLYVHVCAHTHMHTLAHHTHTRVLQILKLHVTTLTREGKKHSEGNRVCEPTCGRRSEPFPYAVSLHLTTHPSSH